MTPLVKCVVWDLDDTLWQGTIAEDDTVRPVRHRFALLRELDGRGVLQTVASRGDRARAEERLRAYGLFDLLVLPQIGWRDKSEAVGDIIGALGFAPATFLFVDNDPFERAEVTSIHPGVRCLAPEAADGLLATVLAGLPVTSEASTRRISYQTGARRRDAELRAGDRHAFEQSLGLRLVVRPATVDDLARCTELTRRTTQLNTTGRVVPEPELLGMLDVPGHAVLVVFLSDRFGDYGLVGLAVLRIGSDTWDLLLLATSCRVLSRGVGGLVLTILQREAARADRTLVVDFVSTERNRPMLLALRFAGFTPVDGVEGGGSQRLVAGRAARALPAHVDVDLIPSKGSVPW
jgi:FkbH-like protein